MNTLPCTEIDLSHWLIGPIEQETLDMALQSELMSLSGDLVFFKAQDQISRLRQTHASRNFQGVLVIEPLRRLLPEDIWEIDLPLIGLCSRINAPQKVQNTVLEAFSGIILLENLCLKDLAIPVANQPVWIVSAVHHSKKNLPVLHPILYVNPDSVSPWMAEYEKHNQDVGIAIEYFIQAHPGRLPFHFQRAKVVLMDSPLSSLHFQVVACGAFLLVHRDSPGIEELESYLRRGQDFDYYDADDLMAQIEQATLNWNHSEHSPSSLQSLTLSHTLRKALTELQSVLTQSSIKPVLAPDHDPAYTLNTIRLRESIQLCLLNQPNALNRLRQKLDLLPIGQERSMIEICFYMQLLVSPYSKSDPRQIMAAIQARLQTLPSTSEVKLLSALIAMHQGGEIHCQNALSTLTELQHEADLFEQCQSIAHWQMDPLYQELQQTFRFKSLPQQILETWLHYQQIMCLAHLQDFQAARESAEKLLRRHYFPLAASLWLALQSEVQSQPIVPELLKEHPQHLELAKYWIRAQSQEKESLALTLCESYLNLSRRLLNKSHELEGFLALRQKLIPVSRSESAYILWEGPLYSYSSLASINRQWMSDLLHDTDFKISHIPFEPPELPKACELLPLEQLHDQPVDVFVAHHWPPRELAPAQGKWINIIPWEFGVIPQSWVHYLNQSLDQIWVPSEFVAQSFELSGVARDHIEVIPNGYDPVILNSQGETYPLPSDKGFRFLFVGGMLDRKGVDLLLEAYARSFNADDDVSLVIKSFGSNSHYALNSFEQQIQAIREQANAPEIICIEDDLSPEQMAALYRSCHVYVHPYRGEGFGMPILEAMACGLPLMIPNAGPAPEFCPPQASWQIATRIQFKESRDVQGLGLAIGPPYYTEVDLNELCRAMLQAVGNPKLCQQKGANAAQAARAYSWQALYPRLKKALQSQISKSFAKRELVPWRQQQIQNLTTVNLEQKKHLIQQDPELIQWILPTLAAQDLKPLWKLALNQGLEVSSALQIAKSVAGFWPGLPMRLHYLPTQSEAALCLPMLNSHARMTLLSENLHTDLCLSYGANTFADLCWIWQNKIPEYLNASQSVWYSHPEQKNQLLKRGFAAEQIAYLPLAVDFAYFHPQAHPLVLEESLNCFVFLTIFDWRHGSQWQDLLKAYFANFTESDPVNLVFKAYGEAFEQMVESLMSWIESAGFDPESVPGLTFVQEDLNPDTLPGLYRGADCFVSTDPIDGIWYLAAQASGLPVISPGHYPFLQRPLSEPYSDCEHLGWLMKAHWKQTEAGRGQVVRDYLQQNYHLDKWKEQSEALLMRAYLLKKT